MRTPSFSRVDLGELALGLFEWPGSDPGLPPLLLVHATGFHARCWDAVVELLPDFHIFAPDMRGHGRSEKPAPPYPWTNYVRDVVALAEQLGLRGALGVGHSKGGYAVARAAAWAPGVFAGLLLVDPVIMARERYGDAAFDEHFAARRRNHWNSPDEMYERFRARPPFASWQPRVLRDYCDHGLLPSPDGDGYVLACPPAIEAATYAGSAGQDPFDDLARVEIPVRILRGRTRAANAMDMSSSPTLPGLWRHFPNATDRHLPGHSHFIPMEDPALVAHEIRALVARL